MAECSAPNTFLFLDEMDQGDVNRYRARLNHMHEIVDTAEDTQSFKSGGSIKFLRTGGPRCIYRVPAVGNIKGDGPHFYEVVATIAQETREDPPALRLAARHSDEVTDYAIHSHLLPEFGAPALDDKDALLDYIEAWADQLDGAFTARGSIGPEHLETVEAADTRAQELLTALIHAYYDFEDDEKFIISIQPGMPRDPATIRQVLGESRFDFIVPAAHDTIASLLPEVARLCYTSRDGFTTYWIEPLPEILVEVTGGNVPSEETLVTVLKPILHIPAPHFLDQPAK